MRETTSREMRSRGSWALIGSLWVILFPVAVFLVVMSTSRNVGASPSGLLMLLVVWLAPAVFAFRRYRNLRR